MALKDQGGLDTTMAIDLFTQMGQKKFKPSDEDLERIKTLKCLEDQLKKKKLEK